MRQLAQKIKPKHGYFATLHLSLTIALPLILYVLVRVDLEVVAVIVLLLSKWRMFAVRPRYWVANIRGNAVDIFVGLAVVAIMATRDETAWQVSWAALYGLWLVFIKPRSTIAWSSVQALIGQTLAFSAVYLVLREASTIWLILIHWLICYYAARHFFSSFEETHARFLAFMWAYFGALLAWLLGHWQIIYPGNAVAQPTLMITVLSFGLSGVYYLDHFDRLSKWARRELIFIVASAVSIIVYFSNIAIEVTR